jgi:hypothetical protein
MLGAAALSKATANTCPTCAAVAVNGLGAVSACACGGPPALRRSITRADGPAGSMKVTATGSTPCGAGVSIVTPEKPLTTASPSPTTALSLDCAAEGFSNANSVRPREIAAHSRSSRAIGRRMFPPGLREMTAAQKVICGADHREPDKLFCSTFEKYRY